MTDPAPIITAPINNPPAPPAPTNPPAGTDPEKNVVDISKFTDEQFAKFYEDPRAFNHPRFKELAEDRQKLKEIQAAKAQEEEAKLIADKKYEEVIKNKDTEIGTLREQFKNRNIDMALQNEAVKAKAVDPSVLAKLIDRSKITVNEDGSITGVEEAINELLKSSPFLFGSDAKPIGSTTNPPAPTTIFPFKKSQFKDHKFYMEHQKEMDAASMSGKVENDC